MRSIQDLEAGVNYPSAGRLKALMVACLRAGALAAGREVAETEELLFAVLHEAPRMRTRSTRLVLQATGRIGGAPAVIWGLAMSGDGARLESAGLDRTIQLLDTTTGD